jgi:hypothetical protein
LQDALTKVLSPFEKLSFTLDKNQILVSTLKHVEAREKRNAPADEPRADEK